MLAKMLDLKQTACIQPCFDISIFPFCCIHVRLISPGITAQNRVGGSRKSWTYHTQDSPALCTWEPSPGTGVVVSARRTDFCQGLNPPCSLAAEPSIFVLTCFAPPTPTLQSLCLLPQAGLEWRRKGRKWTFTSQISCPQWLRAGQPRQVPGAQDGVCLLLQEGKSDTQAFQATFVKEYADQTVTVRAHVMGLTVPLGSYSASQFLHR